MGVLWPVYILQHLTFGYQCVVCCDQSAYCNIWQKCNGKKNVQYFLRIKAQLRICMFVKFCDILPPKFASYLICSVAEEIASWTLYSEMCLCPSVCCILKFIYIYIYIYISLNEILICITYHLIAVLSHLVDECIRYFCWQRVCFCFLPLMVNLPSKKQITSCTG